MSGDGDSKCCSCGCELPFDAWLVGYRFCYVCDLGFRSVEVIKGSSGTETKRILSLTGLVVNKDKGD